MKGDSVKIRTKMLENAVEVKMLLTHEMETGLRKTPEGKTIPAWFIQVVTVKCNGRVVFKAQCGTAVSKNPFFSFTFSEGKVGDHLEVTWQDNKGSQGKGEAKIT